MKLKLELLGWILSNASLLCRTHCGGELGGVPLLLDSCGCSTAIDRRWNLSRTGGMDVMLAMCLAETLGARREAMMVVPLTGGAVSSLTMSGTDGITGESAC